MIEPPPEDEEKDELEQLPEIGVEDMFIALGRAEPEARRIDQSDTNWKGGWRTWVRRVRRRSRPGPA